MRLNNQHRRKNITAILAYLVAIFLAGCLPLSQEFETRNHDSITQRISQLTNLSQPLRWEVAHRGVRDASADNTIGALVTAARLNVSVVEFDIRTSSDGELFLYHDRRINSSKFRNAVEVKDAAFSSLLSDQIRKLRYADKTKSRIPTLSEALTALRPYPILILPEIKEFNTSKFTAFIEILRAENFYERSVLQCSSESMTRDVIRMEPKLKLAVRVGNTQQLSDALIVKPTIVQIDESWMTSPVLLQIRNAGARTMIKTLDGLGDTTAHRKALFGAGVDLVLTDYSATDIN